MCVVKTKAAVRARDGYRCAKCGMTNEEHRDKYGRQLDVHRLDPGSIYYPDGCVALCRACHSGEHKSLRDTPPRAGQKALGVYIDEKLADALAAYIRDTRPKPSKTSVIELALEKLLTDAGYWPLGPSAEDN
jgi:hypothetical protein